MGVFESILICNDCKCVTCTGDSYPIKICDFAALSFALFSPESLMAIFQQQNNPIKLSTFGFMYGHYFHTAGDPEFFENNSLLHRIFECLSYFSNVNRSRGFE